MIHTTIGLYPNGEFRLNGVKPEHLKEHIEYNKKYRFGRALFVDGKCEYKGHVDSRDIKKFEKRIISENIKVDKCTAPYN